MLADFDDAFAHDSEPAFCFVFFSFDAHGVSWEKKLTMLLDFMKREYP